MVKELSDGVTETQILQKLWKKWSLEKIIYDNGVRALLQRFSKTRILFIFFVCIFIHISANMSPFALKFSQMILHTERSKLMYNRSYLFEVLHQPTLLPSTFKAIIYISIGRLEWIFISLLKSATLSLQTSDNNLKPP